MIRAHLRILCAATAAVGFGALPAAGQELGDPLSGHPASQGDFFGVSIATDGEFLVVGASGFASGSGNAYIYQVNEDKQWSYLQDLRSIAPVVLLSNDQFGRSVAISDGVILVGAPGRNVGGVTNRGEVFTFTFNDVSQAWASAGALNADSIPAESAQYGLRLAFDGQTALIGAPAIDSSSGAVFFFDRSGGAWSSAQRVDMPGGLQGVCFGDAVDVRGDVAVVGAPKQDMLSGRAYVYRSSGSEWTLEETLGGDAPVVQGWLGASVATNGSSVILGAPHSFMPAMEQVRIFRYEEGAWVAAESFPNPDPTRPGFGSAAAAFGNIAMVGAHRNTAPGVAYVLRQEFDMMKGAGLTWTLAETLLPADGVGFINDRFGAALAVAPPKSNPAQPLESTLVGLAVGSFASSGVAGSAFTYQLEDFGPSDCNENGVPDFIDIADGFSADCNDNMLPDECEPDIHFMISGYYMGSDTSGPTTGGAQLVFEGMYFPSGMQGMKVWFEHDGVMIEVDPDSILAVDPDTGEPSCNHLAITAPAFPPPCDCGTSETFDADIIFMDRGGHMFRLSELGLAFSYTNTRLFVSPGQSIQSRVNDVVNGGLEGVCIVVNPGVYFENVVIGPDAHKLTLTSTNLDTPGQTRIRGGASFTPEFPTVTVTGPSSDISICGLNLVIGNSGVLVEGDSTVRLIRNRIENNWAGVAGGGVRIQAGAEEGSPSVLLEDSVVVLNNAYGGADGGGVAVLAGDAVIRGSRIISNDAAGGNGGGVYIDNANVDIFNNDILINYASMRGGGIWLGGDSNVSIRNNAITDNRTKLTPSSSGGVGGAIYAQDDVVFYLFANELENNISGSSSSGSGLESHVQGGGGVHLDDRAEALIAANRIVGNIGDGSGGGVYCGSESMPFIENNLIEDNHASDWQGLGGGVFVGSFNLATIRENIIKDNRAERGAGIMTSIKSEAMIDRNVIAFNQLVQHPIPPGVIRHTLGPGVLAGDAGDPVGPAPNILDNTLHQNDGLAANRITATLHGVRIGLFEPQWSFNIISEGVGVEWGVHSDEGVNTGVRINFNLLATSSDLISPSSDIPGGPAHIGNMQGDPMFIDPSNCDFRVFPGSIARTFSGDINDPIGAAKPDGLVCAPVGEVHDTGSNVVLKFGPKDDDDDDDEIPDVGERNGCSIIPIVPTEVYIDVRHLRRGFLTDANDTLDAATLYVDIKTIYGDLPIGPDGFTLCIPARAPLTPGQDVTLYRSTSTTGPFMPLGVVGTVDETGELVNFPGVTAAGVQMGQGVTIPYIFVGADIGPDCNGNGVPDDVDPDPCIPNDRPICASPDINRDGVINSVDLGSLLAAWGDVDDHCDLNGDGVVNAPDLGILLSHWGPMPLDPCRP